MHAEPRKTDSRTIEQIDTVVIGAGPAGLATAACLKQHAIPFALLERSDRVGSSWHRHYDRLHLHTVKQHSSLPGLPFPESCPRYPSRAHLLEYLETYARHFELGPRFGQEVSSVRLRDGRWQTRTASTIYLSKHVVVTTGYNCQPNIPEWPGQAQFRGEILHSSTFRNGERFRGRRVMVVGIGNSGGEIAIDLVEHGVETSISVRSPVHVVPRDFMGRPTQLSSIFLSRLPVPVADALSTRVSRMIYGDLSRYGLMRPSRGPIRMIMDQGRVPLVDIGTIDLIKKGKLTVVPDIARFTEHGVELTDGSSRPLDAVLLATGYRPRLDRFLEAAAELVNERGHPRWHGEETPLAGLYFVGYRNPPTGALRHIGIEANRVARDIDQKVHAH